MHCRLRAFGGVKRVYVFVAAAIDGLRETEKVFARTKQRYFPAKGVLNCECDLSSYTCNPMMDVICWPNKQGSRLIPRRPKREINLEPRLFGQQSTGLSGP